MLSFVLALNAAIGCGFIWTIMSEPSLGVSTTYVAWLVIWSVLNIIAGAKALHHWWLGWLSS